MKLPIVFVLACILWGCTGNKPTSITKSDSIKPSVTQSAKKKTGKVEITNAEPFFQGLDNLQAKVKKFDPSMGELNVMESDSIFFEGKDAHHNKLWVAGANNGIGQISWIWNHDGFKKPPANAVNNFSSIAKMMCGEKGQQWVLDELKKTVTVEKHIYDTAHINYNKVIFYNDCLTTINFTVKMQ